MELHFKFLGASILVASLIGCAYNGGTLQRETGRFIGSNVGPDQVTVSDIDRGITAINWKASAPTGTYDCSTHYMLYVVYCIRK